MYIQSADIYAKKQRFPLLLITLFLLLISTMVHGSEYSQPGFYEVDHFQLDNGLRVILKPRHNVRNVAIELQVNIGHLNFPCGKRETAHFLEHLLFTGTSTNSETELEEIVETHGGSWNAQTSNEFTLYSMEIYSKHLDVGLKTLFSILTDSTISEENVEKSRNIVFREDGGKPSAIRQWLYENGIIESTYTRGMNVLFPGVNYRCQGLDETSQVSRQDVLKAYEDYYTPNNMTIALVGDFENNYARQLINETFGSMQNKPAAEMKPRPMPGKLKATSKIIEGRLHPLVGNEAAIYFAYRTGGIYSPQYYALSVLEKYFQTELYNQLRIEKGMAYSPYAYAVMHDDYGAFVMETDSNLQDVDVNIEHIKSAIDQFKSGKLDEERLQSVKRKILLNSARGYESNASFAEYYALTVEDIKRHGKFINYEDNIEKVSLDDIRKAADTYFHDDNLVMAVVRPTFSYTQFYIIVIGVILLIIFVIWRIVRKIKVFRAG